MRVRRYNFVELLQNDFPLGTVFVRQLERAAA